MRGLTEARGARQAILHQAAFYPEEGLSYEAFLKVLPLPQQAAGRQLLREGYLLRNANNGIVLSPLIKKEPPVWNESTRAFLTSLTEYLADLISEELIANHRAKQAKSDAESLRTLVFLHYRDKTLPSFDQRLAEEAVLLFQKRETVAVMPKPRRDRLVKATIGIEIWKNRRRLAQEAALLVPTMENILSRVKDIPTRDLYEAYDWLSTLYFELEDARAPEYIEKWRLLQAATSPAFEIVRRHLGETLYDPLAGDKTVGEMLRRWKEDTHEE